MMEVKIFTESITLGQFLKFTGLVATGGQTKDFLSANIIMVNGFETQQRGKKLFPGDVIKVAEAVYQLTR